MMEALLQMQQQPDDPTPYYPQQPARREHQWKLDSSAADIAQEIDERVQSPHRRSTGCRDRAQLAAVSWRCGRKRSEQLNGMYRLKPKTHGKWYALATRYFNCYVGNRFYRLWDALETVVA